MSVVEGELHIYLRMEGIPSGMLDWLIIVIGSM
jgi:hypothetical protein